MITMTSRRAMLAGLAATPSIAATTVAVAGRAPAAPDPILALIERHREAYEAEHRPGPWGDEELDAAMNAEGLALEILLSTKPTTLAGCCAALRYIQQHALDIDMKPVLGDYVSMASSDHFLSLIACAIEGVDGKAVRA